MNRVGAGAVASVAIVVASPWVSSASAQCLRYSVDVIQPPGPCLPGVWPGIGATGISESGEICGGGGTCGKTQSAHYAWYGGPPIVYLPMPPAYPGGYATDINSSRQVVGFMTDLNNSSIRRAYLHYNGVAIDLGVLPGYSNSEAWGISEDGTVCGTSRSPDLRAFVWKDGVISAIPLPMGPNSEALGMSNNGLVCGLMGAGGIGVSHAFIYDTKTGRVVDLGTPLPGSTNARATGVNSIGAVCGRSWFPCSPGCGVWKGFFWKDGHVTDLGNLPGLPRTIPLDLNDSDIVVGFCSNDEGNPRAFVWQNGAMHALQDLIPPEYNVLITTASAINNAGQIAATGFYPDPNDPGSNIYVAMRLNPIPPLTGDITCDWKVNVPDLLAVLNAWGPCPPPPPNEPFTKNCHADLNDDGVVALDDLLTVVLNWAP